MPKILTPDSQKQDSADQVQSVLAPKTAATSVETF